MLAAAVTGEPRAEDLAPGVRLARDRESPLAEPRTAPDCALMSRIFFYFGLYLFLNAKALLAKASGPYFYLPKLESAAEAKLWNEVFLDAQATLGIAKGSIKATVLIETILAAFEMDEIL
jgi:malate synthase